jgi:hypothetical protein
MKIEIGHSITNDVKTVDADRVRFVANDGNTMFEVSICKDGRSLEIRGINVCKVDGVLYSETIDIRPRTSNSVEIRARLYDDY